MKLRIDVCVDPDAVLGRTSRRAASCHRHMKARRYAMEWDDTPTQSWGTGPAAATPTSRDLPPPVTHARHSGQRPARGSFRLAALRSMPGPMRCRPGRRWRPKGRRAWTVPDRSGTPWGDDRWNEPIAALPSVPEVARVRDGVPRSWAVPLAWGDHAADWLPVHEGFRSRQRHGRETTLAADRKRPSLENSIRRSRNSESSLTFQDRSWWRSADGARSTAQRQRT